MSLMITESCVDCGICEPVCPNNAISEGPGIFAIDPSSCTECMGWHPESQCTAICPVDAPAPDPAHAETPEQLRAKYVYRYPNRLPSGRWDAR
jgi:ferredoxin